jgi:ribosome hibernation promoting factor
MQIDVEGVPKDARMRGRVARGLEKALARIAVKPTSALISFTDVNGPKGGVDTRCAITVWLARRPAIHVEELATDGRLALAATLEVLERRLRRQGERSLERRRRPKKYYLAKRLLEPEADTGSIATPARRRRRAR